jgi:hypothetical protein
MRFKIRRQRPIKGGRVPLPSCVLREIEHEVQRLARKHRVSRSFVIAATLADAFGVEKQEHYDEPPVKQLTGHKERAA